MVISLDIPNAQAVRIGDAVCALNGYDATVDGTKLAFLKKWIIRKLKEETKAYERGPALRAAELAVDASVETGIVIT